MHAFLYTLLDTEQQEVQKEKKKAKKREDLEATTGL